MCALILFLLLAFKSSGYLTEYQKNQGQMNKQIQNTRTPFVSKTHTAKPQGASEKRHKNSNSSVKSSNAPFSQYNHKYKECRSHVFQLKPLDSTRGWFEPISLKLGHINEMQKPYPVVLKEYLAYGLAPLFGLTIDNNTRSKSVNKMKEQLELQIARVNMGQGENDMLLTPKPKHSTCQVCRRQYADYANHVNSSDHRQAVKESVGFQYIQETIDQFRLAIQDETNEQDLASLFNLAVSLEDVIPSIRDHFKSFLVELQMQRSRAI